MIKHVLSFVYDGEMVVFQPLTERLLVLTPKESSIGVDPSRTWQRGGVNISAEIPDQLLPDQTGDATGDDHDDYSDGYQPTSDQYSSQSASEASGTVLSGSSTALEERTRLEARSRQVTETHGQTS